jgi:hypothetical protein
MCIKKHKMSGRPIVDNTNFGHLVEAQCVRFFHWKVTISLFIIRKKSMERNLLIELLSTI